MIFQYFEPTAEMDSFLNNKDTNAVRGIVTGIINRDPTFATTKYKEAMTYIDDNMNIWDTETLELPGEYTLTEEQWNKEYFRKQLAWLSQNFTKDRVEQIEKIGKRVYAEESTWGKEEAANFSRPVTQEMEEVVKSQSGIGGIILAMIALLAIIIMVIIVPNIALIIKVLILIAATFALLACVGGILKQRKK